MTQTRQGISAAIITGVVGAESFLVQPGLLGGLVESLELSAQQAGYVVSGDMFGMALASLLLSTVASRLSWRVVLIASMVAIVLGNLLCLMSGDVGFLVGARLLAGVGYGGFVSLSFVALGQAEHQERAYGYYISWCLGYGALGLFALPHLIAFAGMAAVFGLFALLPVLAIPALLRTATMQQGDAQSPHAASSSSLGALVPLLGLVAIFSYFLAQGSVWAYLDRMGVAGGLSFETVGSALAICSVAGILGAILATWQGGSFGRTVPLAIGIAGSVTSLLLMAGPQTMLRFTILASLFNGAWNYVHPYLLSTMASHDRSGRLIIWTAGLQTLGLAFGPAAAAAILSGDDYGPVRLLATGLFVASLLLIAPASRPSVGLNAPSRASS